MRRAINDALISACALAVLFIGLVAMDPRLREAVALRADSATASTEVAGATAQARKLGNVAYQVVKEQAEAHVPLAVMLVVGVGLMAIMFRS